MRLSYRRRLGAALVLCAVVGSTAATAGDDLIACREKGQIQVRKDGWTRINPFLPDGGEGPREVYAFTVAPRSPNRVFQTNGQVIKLSADGGCTWNFIAGGSQVRIPNGENDVYTHLAAGNDDVLWAASYDDAGAVRSPHVRVFQNVGPNAELPVQENRMDTGLPPVGWPIDLVISRIDPSTAHVLIEQPPDGSNGTENTRHLYVTKTINDPPALTAAGAMWRKVVPPEGFGQIEGIANGPSNSLWIWAKNKIAVTPEAFADEITWAQPKVSGGTVVSIDVNVMGEALVALDSGQGVVTRTIDSKSKVTPGRGLPVTPVSMTHGNRPETRVVSGSGGVWGFDPNARRWVNITPKGVGTIGHLEMGSGRTGRILLGHNRKAMWRWDLYPGESFLPVKGISGTGDWPDLPHSLISDPYLKVSPRTVTVRPGQIKDIDIEFGMPAAANPLDVYFLLDTTGSMGPTIESLTVAIKDIASQLRKRLGQNACFGLGEFKDTNPSGPSDTDKVFRTHVKIACEDESLPLMSAALKNRKELYSSGGHDIPEAGTVALNQMLTGAGQVNPLVLPGHDARFRHEAYKVVVMLTDAPYKEGGGYGTVEQTANTLRVNGIKVVNVLVHTPQGDAPKAREHMTVIANETNSVAPPGGVDCDGDGKWTMADVDPGGPLICEADGTNPNLGPVIVALVLGVEDPGTLAVNITDVHDVIREPIKGPTSKIFNLKRDAWLKFTMPVSCTQAQDGLDLPILLSPTVRALPMDILQKAIVRCRSVPVPPPVERPAPPPAPPIADPPAPVLPRIPVAIALPPPPNPPVQPVSNINPNAGFSQQEEQQLQLAAVTQGAEEQQQEEEAPELAMSALESDLSATPVAGFLAGAVILSSAAAAAHRRRLQRTTRESVARVRSF
ncbi:MAG TPA: vWA domain-containing protein [Frankiaceae bacterium]|nr:vWA domain-containing protein [Frankiaceae bacterium]